ncbi:hypothetical protein BGX29_004654 [Mortierella sp. GBA35]|nr:hypothetical protein BGX29_004654 [Mortierella sp. GBA35]
MTLRHPASASPTRSGPTSTATLGRSASVTASTVKSRIGYSRDVASSLVLSTLPWRTRPLQLPADTVEQTQFFSKDAAHVFTTSSVPGGSVLKRTRNKSDPEQPPATYQDPKRMATNHLALPLAPDDEADILVKALEPRIRIWTLDEASKLLSYVDPRLGTGTTTTS